MNISRQSMARIEDLMNMSEDARKAVFGTHIENPQLYKEFVAGEFSWDYAVAAGLLTRDDVRWIKEKEAEESQEEPTEPIL